MERKLEKVCTNLQMVDNMLETLVIIKCKEWVNIHGQIKKYMKVNGFKVKWKGKESLNGLMVRIMMVSEFKD